MKELKTHPLCELFPAMATGELEELAADILENGQREPIILLGDAVLDGRNRYLACCMEGIEPRFEQFDGGDPLAFVLSKNLCRRHLDASQRAMVASRLATLEKHSNQYTAKSGAQICATSEQPVSQGEAAELLNVSRRAVQQARKVQEQGEPELVSAVESGKVSVSDAARIAEQPAEVQRSAVEAVNQGKARTVSEAAEPDQPKAADFDKLHEAIGKALRARDDLERELGKSTEAVALLEQLRTLNDTANDWKRSASRQPSKGSTLDRLKRAVPERFAAVFSRANVFDSIRNRLNTLRAELDALCQEPLGVFLHRQGVLADIDNLKSALKFSRPYTVCPYCRGNGCKGCKQQGWITEDGYKSAPREMKAELTPEHAA